MSAVLSHDGWKCSVQWSRKCLLVPVAGRREEAAAAAASAAAAAAHVL